MLHLFRLYAVMLASACIMLLANHAHSQCIADAGAAQTVCAGSSVILGGASSASGGLAPYTYVWTGATGIAPSPNPSWTASTTSILTLTITDATGCVASDEVEITVLAAPTANGGNDRELCLNSPSVNLGGGGVWSGSASVSSSGIFNPNQVGDHNLILTVSNGTCSASDAVLVKVLALPVANAGVDQSICAGQSTSLSASGTSPNGAITLYTWSGGAVSNSLSPSPNVTPNNTTTYNVTVVDAKGCSDPDQVTVFVNSLPTVDAGANVTLCNSGNAQQLSGQTPSGGVWSGLGVASNGMFTSPGLGTYTLTYTFTNNNNCSNSDTRVVTVTAGQAVNAGSDYQVCLNAPALTLAPVTSGGTWSGSNLVTSGGSFTPTSAGTYTLTYTVSDGVCSGSDQAIVTVYDRPVVDAGQNFSACNGVSTPINGSVSGGTAPYTYTWSPSANLSANNILNPTGTFTAGTTLILTAIDSRGCSASDNLLVSVIPTPNVYAGPDITLCNQPVVAQMGNYTPAGGTWSGPGVLANGNFTPPGVGDFTLTYSVTGANGCIGSDTRIVHVVPPTGVDAGPDQTICLNAGPTTLQPVTQGGFWSGNTQVSFSGIFTPAQVGTFNLAYTVNGGNCSVTDNIIVNVVSPPTVSVTSPLQACAGTTINSTINASGGTGIFSSYTWLNGNDNQVIASTQNAALNFASDTPLIVQVADNAGCVGTANITFDALDLPVVSAGNDVTFCNQPLPNALTGFSPAGGIWSGTGVTNAGVYTPSGVGNTTLSYCFTNAQGCSACDQVNVTVVDPTPVSAGPNQSICLNAAPVALSLGTTDNGTWSGNGIVNSANGLFNPATAGIGLHTITLTAGTGNCQTSDQMQVTVLNVPSVNAGGNVSVCRNTSEYTIDGGVPANGTWSGSGVISQNIAGDVVFFFDATQAPGAYNATYTIQDITTGCANSASRTINIVALPIASFSTPSVSCEDSDLNLVNNSVGATQYRWNFNGEGISNVANPQFHFDEEGPKNIQLRVLNDIGCADSTEHNTVVVEAPEADFDADQFDGCAPLTVNFEDHSEGDNLSYAWNFVNSTSTSANPAAVTFNASSITTDYLVTLTVSNACGTDTKMESVTVHPKPTASIQMDLLSTACTPVLVDIQNSSFGEVEQWSWNLDNGFTTSSQSPGEHSFTTGNSPTTYDVRLIVTNDCGSDTIVQPLVVQPNHVHASFDVNATVGCTPFTLQCTNTSQGATALHYDFASQEVSSNPNAAYTFENPGIYTVKLSATDGCGVDEMVKTIQVNQSPVSGFSMSTNEACEQSDVTFQCLSSLPDLQWNMGDGTVGTGPTFTHSFVGANDYTVSLQVTAANGCTNTSSQTIAVREKPVANFSAEYSSSCTPMEACINNSTTGADVYHWQFGLGEGSSDEISPCYTYINGTNDLVYQNIELQASNAYGCTDTKVVQVAIKPRPSGYFELSAYSSCTLPFEVQSSSTDPLSSEYSWRVNGVEVANTQDTPIQFNAIGDYEIEFFTENSFGCADSSSRSFYVYEPVEASITSSASSGCLPLEIQFSNASVNAEFMQWNFDDGGTSTELNPVHTFEEQGVFDISVVAISPDGCRDTLEVMNMIETFEKPEASFVFTPNETSIYFPEVHFTNTCSDASTVQWNFGDGDLGYGQSTVHTYEHAGQWNATQTVTNIFGCTDSKTEVVTITNEFFVYVPNAFTPDGDGINDVFKPEFEGLEFVEKYNFKIFNRWGVEVFSTDDPKMAWVGNHQGGDQYVENVAYTYRISLKFVDNVTEKILEGAVVIIR